MSGDYWLYMIGIPGHISWRARGCQSFDITGQKFRGRSHVLKMREALVQEVHVSTTL